MATLMHQLREALRGEQPGFPSLAPLDAPSEPSTAVYRALRAEGARPRPVADALSRAGSLVGALLALLVLWPLMAGVALAVLCTSGRPVFYRGARVGRGGVPFTMVKFRTMRLGTEAELGARLLRPEDDPYTPVGRVLRSKKLDELPQLWNVLRGEMNLVGPRPARPLMVTRWSTEVSEFGWRHAVRPGITGLAQVRGGYSTAAPERLLYDLTYIARRSPWTDLQILLLTVARLGAGMLSAGFALGWLALFVLLTPSEVRADFDLGFAGQRVQVAYLVPVAVAALLLLKRREPPQIVLSRTRLDTALALYLALMAASVWLSAEPARALRGAGYYTVTGIVTFYLVVNSRVSGEALRQALRGMALLGGLAALCGAASRLGILPATTEGGLEGTLHSSVAAGLLPLVVALRTTAKRLETRRFWLAVLGLLGASSAFHATWPGTAAATLGVLVTRRGDLPRVAWLAVAGLWLATALSAPALAWPGLEASGPVQWLLGLGPRVGDAPVSFAARLLEEQGLCGLLAFGLLGFTLLKAALRGPARRVEPHAPLLDGLAGALAAMLLLCALAEPFEGLALHLAFWTAAGLVMGATARAEAEPHPYRLVCFSDTAEPL